MAKVTVIVAGSALWVPRRDSWSVLFPKAVEGNPQHIPFLSYHADGGAAEPEVSITGKCVRVVGVHGEGPTKQALSWLCHLHSEADADVRTPACARKSTVIAELQLPRCTLMAGAGTFVGPILDPATGVVDHYWSYAGRIEFEVRDSAATVLTSRLGSTEEIESVRSLNAADPDITIRVRNVTAFELDGDCTGTTSGEALREMKDLFALVGTPHRELPIYTGRDLEAACNAGFASDELRVLANPFRLCPQGYCEDCPDD
jgi:hypothetical protein